MTRLEKLKELEKDLKALIEGAGNGEDEIDKILNS